MDLNNFENYMDSVIVMRGLNYYKNDKVTSIRKTEDRVYAADVEGSEFYTVDVKLDADTNIIYTHCDCPYDMGEYCKHQAAVFFALRDMKDTSGNSDMFQNDTDHDPKVINEPDISKMLTQRTKDELIRIILDITSENEEIMKRMICDLNGTSHEYEMSNAVSIIRSYIRNNSYRGMIDPEDAYDAVKGAYIVLEKASTFLDKGKSMLAFDLVLCVIREMMDLLEKIDDPYDAVDETISECYVSIYNIFEDDRDENYLNEENKTEIFNKVIKEVSNKQYNGRTDLALGLLDCCAMLTDIPDIRKKLEDRLNEIMSDIKNDSGSIEYITEKVDLIRYDIIEKNDGQDKTKEFVKKNLNISSFREIAVHGSLNENDYDLTIKLTLEGEEIDKDDREMVSKWRTYRYLAYQGSGMIEGQRELAVYFILDGSIKHYKELKKTYEPNEWLMIYPGIILQLENQKDTHRDIYTHILIEEGAKQKLLEYIKENPNSIEKYYKHLLPEYKDEIYSVYIRQIRQLAARANKRKDYQSVCGIILNLKKAGGTEQALNISRELFTAHVNQPAFKSELKILQGLIAK